MLLQMQGFFKDMNTIYKVLSIVLQIMTVLSFEKWHEGSDITVFLNCFGSILNFFFFFETISSDLWTKLLVHIRWEFLIDLCKLQKLWHMCANSKNNCLQFAQQLIAYGLLIKTDESILTYVKLFTTSQSFFLM